MNRKLALPAAALLAALFVTCTAQRTPELRAGDRVPYPEGYRTFHHVKSMVIEEGHALHAAFGGIHHVYANDAALAGLRSGQFGDGAVFAFDLLAADRRDHAVVEGDRKVLGVMHKSTAAFPNTGGWGFAGFAADGKDVVGDMQQCYQCHAAEAAHGYVFSRLRP